MQKIKLTEDRYVGETYSPFIIAEIGNNHNGDIKNAFELIKIASVAGYTGQPINHAMVAALSLLFLTLLCPTDSAARV